MTAETYLQRLGQVRQSLREQKFQALVVLNRASIRYLTGFTGSSGVLIVGRDEWTRLVTDGRYTLQAKEQTQGTDLKISITRQYHKVVAQILKKHTVRHAGIESRYCSLSFFDAISTELKGSFVRLSNSEGIVEQFRAIKDEQEIQLIRQSARLADSAFQKALKALKVGVTEKELSWIIESFLRTHGADTIAFPPIVVSGPRTEMPHGQPSDRTIQNGDLVTFDLGACVNGYCSDMTRTVIFGKPTNEQKKIYAAVWEAEQRGIDALQRSKKAKDVDRTVRETLKKNGLDKFFTHGTGHGLGLEVHEPPSLNRNSNDKLMQKMVVTIEPGVYVPKVGGVRIEDLIWLTEKGVEILSNAPNPPKLLRV